MVEVIPVLDIRGGQAVSGRSGKREEYAPLQTVFAESSNPVIIAKNIPFKRLYVADLDGVVEGVPGIATLRRLAGLKEIMIDPGVRMPGDLDLFDEVDSGIVLGTETVKGPEVIREALRRFGERVRVSIDIKEGRVLSGFLPGDPLESYEALQELGLSRVIFLNISAVGTEEADFSFIKDLNKAGEILLGGGITCEDLPVIEESGVNGVLVGTALHKGRWM